MSFVKGQSGNPRGRPPNALALAQRIRKATDGGDELIAFALAVFRDDDLDLDYRWAAWRWLADRGGLKAPQNPAATAPPAPVPPRAEVSPDALAAFNGETTLEGLSWDERAEVVALLDFAATGVWRPPMTFARLQARVADLTHDGVTFWVAGLSMVADCRRAPRHRGLAAAERHLRRLLAMPYRRPSRDDILAAEPDREKAHRLWGEYLAVTSAEPVAKEAPAKRTSPEGTPADEPDPGIHPAVVEFAGLFPHLVDDLVADE